MAFFKKLKDRLFKSSSKLDAGLEAIIDEAPEPIEAPAPERAAVAAEDTAPPNPSSASAAIADVDQIEPIDQLELDSANPAVPPDSAEDPSTISLAAPVSVMLGPQPAVGLTSGGSEPPAPESASVSASNPTSAPAEGSAIESRTKGLLGRIFRRGGPAASPKRRLDDEMLEQLEELLIAADMGVDTALRVTANMAEGRFGAALSVADIKGLLAQEITRIMEPVAKPMPLYAKKPQVVLVVGVNGSGKTTTIGKLASQFKAAGKTVVIAAGDTFRAAAVEQLQIWGDRAGVPVLTAPDGSDPASLAFDAMTKAEADGTDLLMIDTAGRLQNRADLMEGLAKIVRVIRKKDPEAPHNTLLVLDATTGQNAISQVETFRRLADVSGLVMTKLDGTAKGGVLVALADKFGLPIHAIGVGEQIDDLAPFDPEEFAAALTGTQR
jgi:fused signal recognition particle receptor